MHSPFFSLFRRAAAVGGVILGLSCHHSFAGAQASADKEVTQQQVAADNAFPLQFSLSTGGDSEFVFRGVNILPEVDINVTKALTEAVNLVPAANGLPSLRDYLLAHGFTPKQFVALTNAPTAPIEVSRESAIYYVDGNVSGYGFTLGAFYATQDQSRVVNSFFGSKPIFDEYHEFDAYLDYSHAFGPVRVTIGGTFYHVINNTAFNTAELNFGVTYTPPQFQYVSASFTYDYASAFDLSGYTVGKTREGYLDGHYLEARIDGNIPLYKHVITFNPYILVSAGAGIEPRAFNPSTLPTFVTTKRLAQGIEPELAEVYQKAATGQGANLNLQNPTASDAAYAPATLDRSFDLSNFQVGFRVPFYLTRHLTIRGDFNYSRPLGNLDREPYNQRDELYGGGTITYSF